MTEAEWLACTDPQKMLNFLRASERKLRLFAVACCRRIWCLLDDDRSRRAVEVTERYVDGLAALSELRTADEAATDAYNDATGAFYRMRTDSSPPASTRPYAAAMHVTDPRVWRLHGPADCAASSGFKNRRGPSDQADVDAATALERVAQAKLLRDVIGPLPFRPVPLDPAWLAWHDATIPKLAEAAYDDRDLPSGHLDAHRLAVLADALEDAGCSDPEILGHCRGSGPHVRGCWVIDLLLGKE
jgi:hypothetical protein